MIKINYHVFYKELKKVVKIAKQNDFRPALQLIRLYTKEDEDVLYIESTNSYVLWQSKIPLVEKSGELDIKFNSLKFSMFPKANAINPNHKLEIEKIENTQYFQTPEMSLRFQESEYIFPKTDNLYKKDEVNYSIGFSKERLDEITQGMEHIIFHFTPNNVRPAYVTGFSDGNEVNHILLPIKID